MIGLGDIAKVFGAESVGKAILHGGQAALKSVTSELLGKRESSSTTSDQQTFDLDSGSEIEEIAKNQGTRADSLDPSAPSINEPQFEKLDQPAVRIDADNLVNSLTSLHKNLVQYLSRIDRNNLQAFDYVKRRMSAQDATAVSIKNTITNFNKNLSGIEARIGKLEDNLKNSESQQKTENLIPDRDDDAIKPDATKVAPTHDGIIKDIEDYFVGAAGTALLWKALKLIPKFGLMFVAYEGLEIFLKDPLASLGLKSWSGKNLFGQDAAKTGILEDLKQLFENKSTPQSPALGSSTSPLQNPSRYGLPGGMFEEHPTTRKELYDERLKNRGLKEQGRDQQKPQGQNGVAPQASGITSFGPPDLARGQTLSPADLIAAMSAITGGGIRSGGVDATKSGLPSPWSMIFGSGVRDRYGGGVAAYGTGPGARGQYGGGVSPYGISIPSGGGNYGPEAGPSTTTGGGAAWLAGQRAAFKQELENNPETKKLLGAIISAENVGAGSGVAESLMNRTQLVNEDRAKRGLPPLTLHDMMIGPALDGSQSFYGPIKHGYISQHLAKMNNPDFANKMYGYIGQAVGGSFVTKGFTDQGSQGDPNYETGGHGVNINRERFNNWGYRGSAEFTQRMQQGYMQAEQAAGGGVVSSANAREVDPNDQTNRPLHYQGSLQFGEDAYKFSTGGMGGHASIPYGDYPIDHSAGPWGQSVGALGLNKNSIFDPQSGKQRAGIELHYGINDNDLTEGCVAIAGGRWPELKAKIEARLQNGEHLYLHMTPNGASIDFQQYLDTKQVEQKSQQQNREWGPGWLDVTKQQMTQQKDGTGITVPLSPQNAPAGYKQTQAKPKSTNRGYRFIPGTIYDQMLQPDGTLKWSPSLIKGNEKGLAFYNTLSPENKAAFDAGKLDFTKMTASEYERLKAIDPNVGQAFQPIQNQVQAGMLPTGWLPSAASIISGAQSLFEGWLDNPWLQKSPNHQVQNRWDDPAFGSVPDTRFSPMGGMIAGPETTESVPHLQTQRVWGATGQAPASGAAVHPAIRFTDSQGRPSAGSPAPAKIVTNPVHPGFGDYSHPDTSVFPAPPSDKPGMTTGKAVVPAVPHIDKQKQYDEARISNARPKTQITIPRHDPEQMEDQPGSRGYGQVRDPDRVGICSV